MPMETVLFEPIHATVLFPEKTDSLVRRAFFSSNNKDQIDDQRYLAQTCELDAGSIQSALSPILGLSDLPLN